MFGKVIERMIAYDAYACSSSDLSKLGNWFFCLVGQAPARFSW